MKRTPLYDVHRALGARMISFAGFEMPVMYSSIIEEHMAVRERAGIFDVSHMGEIFVSGQDAAKFLQWITSNEVDKMKVGRARYNALPTEKGTVVDDLLVYKLDENRYMLVVNAANTEKDFNWLIEKSEGFSVKLENLSSEIFQIALQGPEAEKILSVITDFDLSSIKYYRFRELEILGTEVILSRTGYTGEDGFEIYGPAEEASKFWNALMEAGEDFGLKPAGLGARDTLRLEAGMNLYGNDMDETTTLLEADLEWIVKWEKDFIGKEALLKQKEEGLKRKLVGFEMVDKGVPRHGYRVFVDGKPYGIVASGSYCPYVKKNIGNVYLPIEKTEEGSEFEIEIRGKLHRAKVVPRPFYRRKK